MSVQQFCLRWNNHQPNFISVCSSLLHNGTLVDVTLAAEGKQLQAHKIVLSACSSYFQTLFTTNPCQHPIVILKDVQYDDLKTMVDFMYYGEVNVSQEQLPHILKTAEMLKIKGLAEMPTDPANLTKSDSKSSNEPTELVGSGGGGNGQSGGGGGSSGGLGSSTGGSINDSIWGSTGEVQFQQQQQQHHHHQQQQQQLHHQQQQSSQTQTTQQHHQLRRTPSPLGAGASPATRRKRLRKSSNNGSGDRNISEDPHNTSIDTGNAAANISLSQMGQMSFGAGTGSLSGLAGHSLHTSKLLKESTSTDVEPQPQDSDSLDDGQGHVHMQIKPEVDISGVQQTIPLDISGTTTPSEHDAPNSQSSHSDPTTSSGATETYPSDATVRAVNISSISAVASATLQQQQQQQQQMGTKRNRVLTRQPRVKRDSDSLSNNQISPDPSTTGLDFDPFNTNATGTTGAAATSGSHSAGYTPPGNTHHHHHHHHHHLLSVPPRIERHASEPAPSITPSSPHLLSVPPSTPFLMKQHSDPLLPSQHSQHHFGGCSSVVTAGGSGGGGVTNPFAPLHRQYSHPLPGSGSITSGSSGSSHHHVQSAPLHHISLPESIYASGSPPPAGSSQYLVPQQQQQATAAVPSTSSTSSTGVGVGGGVDESSETPTSPHSSTASTAATSTVNITTKALSLPQFTTTYVGGDSGAIDRGGDRSSSPLSTERSVSVIEAESHHHLHHHAAAVNKFRSSKSASGVLLSDTRAGTSGSSLHPGPISAIQSSSFEHLPTLRVKNEELQRSVSSPQTSREIITLDNPRSSHCPVIRPGPALGCNFCWNTIDGHGRILRRKTKYHCPECQTNLCIVPCFQEYHERLNNEAASSTAPSNDNSKNFASSAGSGGNVARHYTKTESI